MGVIQLQHGSLGKAETSDNGQDGCSLWSPGAPRHQLQHRHGQKTLPPDTILRRYQNQTSTAPVTLTTPIPPVETTPITRETNALFNTNGVTIAVGLDAIFGLALVIFLSGIIYQWKRGQRLRVEQEERDGATDGAEVTPAVSASKDSYQVSSERSGERGKVIEEQLGDEKGGSSKEQGEVANLRAT
ncbi:hypothetical protein QBC36DRAFT_31401 [Triangularia setosa]|uniref:Uncharacterized protein n=1 Tax=Triangularia setosa TaxID=2587417 RepID=A0AAN6W4G9_9PEZI|nr:hypothetical protein QBC36DRAFT_31401 [Podospora setosa]